MAPRRSDRPVVATRRSGRIASRAGSVASSTQEEPQSGLCRPIPQNTTSFTLQSRVIKAVNSVAGQRVTTSSNSRVTKQQKNKSVKSVTSTITRVASGQNPRLPRALVPAFDLIHAIGRILMNRNHIQTLTGPEKDAVISAFVDREDHLKKRADAAEARADELEAELAEALAEAERMKRKSKTPMRDGMFQQSLKKRREQTPASSNTPSTNRAITSTTFQSPIVASGTNDSIDFSTSNLITGTPAPVRGPQSQSSDEDATPRSRTSLFGSFFKTITTPFLSRGKSQEVDPPQQSPQEHLGALPASRKRPAAARAEPDMYTQSQPQSQPRPRAQAQAQQPPAPKRQLESEQQTETRSTPLKFTTSSAQKTARAFTVPSSKNPLQETSLATITEHTETSEQSVIAPTPSRAPRSIAAVRRAQQTPARMASTPTRVWSQQPPPRDTNADRRLGKLRKFQELTNELKALQDDEEVQQITERPLKRVKIDSLVKIPSRRPGESSGTFRMFDIDSDDEMEVDIDQPVRGNIFDLSTTEGSVIDAPPKSVDNGPAEESRETPTTLPAASPAPAVVSSIPAAVALSPAPVPAAPSATPVPAAVETVVPDVPAMKFQFPSVGTLEEGTNDMNNAYLGAKFAYGYQHWMATGELLPLF